VTDRAGNRTTLRQVLRIAKPPKRRRGGRRKRRATPAPVLVLRSEPPARVHRALAREQRAGLRPVAR
jgi:hypothetical protein